MTRKRKWGVAPYGIILPLPHEPRARARGSRVLLAGLAGAVLTVLSWWAFGTMVPGWIGAAVLGAYIGRMKP